MCLNKREAMKWACAVLACEGLDCIVDSMLDYFPTMSAVDRKRIVEAANEIAMQLHTRAGDRVLDDYTNQRWPPTK